MTGRAGWAAARLARTLTVAETILNGRPVMIETLRPEVLGWALRGEEPPPPGEFIQVDENMLDAVMEADDARAGQPEAPSVDEILREASGDDWPREMRAEAFHGLAGDFVAMVEPVTEADPHALLLQFLAAVGNAVGRSAGCMADGAFHATTIWPAVIGASSKSRKGTSWTRVREVVTLAVPDWEAKIVGGLSTGEGLVYQIRDERRRRRKARKDEDGDEDGFVEEVVDAGVHDKRLMVVETEFASVFRVMKRETNTLSSTLRTLWDFGQAGGLTKTEPSRVTGGHVTVIAHITLDELLTLIAEVDISNGFANRFLFCCARRSKLLPDGGFIPTAKLEQLAAHVGAVVRGGSQISRPLQRADEARELWHRVYPQLTADRPGRLGMVLSRAEAQVLRLSLIYAVLDGRDEVDADHLRSALAVWDYCVASAAYVFGATTGNQLADRILASLRQTDGGMTRTSIRELIGGRVTDDQLEAALGLLQRHGLAQMQLETDTGGRPAERWTATVKEER